MIIFFYNREQNWHVIKFCYSRAEVKVLQNKYNIFFYVPLKRASFLSKSVLSYRRYPFRYGSVWRFNYLKTCLFKQHSYDALIFNFWWLDEADN